MQNRWKHIFYHTEFQTSDILLIRFHVSCFQGEQGSKGDILRPDGCARRRVPAKYYGLLQLLDSSNRVSHRFLEVYTTGRTAEPDKAFQVIVYDINLYLRCIKKSDSYGLLS